MTNVHYTISLYKYYNITLYGNYSNDFGVWKGHILSTSAFDNKVKF